MERMLATLIAEASTRAKRAGADEVLVSTTQDVREAEVEGRVMFIEATLTATASGRPRVAHPVLEGDAGEMAIRGTVYGAT